jgi:hypothetical protein
MTWKPWVMPAGLSRFRLRASVPRISETELTGWHTPLVRDHRNSAGNGTNPRDLPRTVPLCGWPTLRANDGTGHKIPPNRQGGVALKSAVQMAGWPTCKATDAIKGGNVSPRPGAMGLSETVPLAGWGTPTATEPGGTPEQFQARKLKTVKGTAVTMLAHQVKLLQPVRLTATGQVLIGSDAGMDGSGPS